MSVPGRKGLESTKAALATLADKRRPRLDTDRPNGPSNPVRTKEMHSPGLNGQLALPTQRRRGNHPSLELAVPLAPRVRPRSRNPNRSHLQDSVAGADLSPPSSCWCRSDYSLRRSGPPP